MPRKRPKKAVAEKVTSRPVGDPADIASKEQCTVHEMYKLTHDEEGKIYLTRGCISSYVEDDIWAILQGCGFEYSPMGFKHEEMEISGIDHEDDVRRQLSEKGLPYDLEDDPDDDDDPMKVQRWVAFAHVPLKNSDCLKILNEVPLPSDYQALVWLGELGFNVDGETGQIYRGDYEQYNSVREIRCFVRSADNARLLSTAEGDMFSPRKRARRATRKQDMPLLENELLALRLWAAVSPTPQKVFGTEYIIDELEDEPAPLLEINLEGGEMEVDSDEDEQQSSDNEKPKKRRSGRPAKKAAPKSKKRRPGRHPRNQSKEESDEEEEEEDVEEPVAEAESPTSETSHASDKVDDMEAAPSNVNNEGDKSLPPMPQTEASSSSCVIL